MLLSENGIIDKDKIKHKSHFLPSDFQPSNDSIFAHKGKLDKSYNESETAKYMKNSDIEINVSAGTGKKSFKAYTMDLTKEYLEINTDYRS